MLFYFQQKTNTDEFNEEALNKYFGKYGDIESIKILNAMEQVAKETTKSKAYANVTFKCDSSAYAAVSDNDYRIKINVKCEYNVQPAHSWKQPSQQKSPVESMTLDEDEDKVHVPQIFKLNKNCFEKLFQYLDVDSLINLLAVCKELYTLVPEYGFKRIKSLTYYNNNYNKSKTLAQMQKELKHVGRNINQLEFVSDLCDNQRYFDILM